MPQRRAVVNKTYYDKNKQKILNWHKVRVPCSQCGKPITRGAMSKHCRKNCPKRAQQINHHSNSL